MLSYMLYVHSWVDNQYIHSLALTFTATSALVYIALDMYSTLYGTSLYHQIKINFNFQEQYTKFFFLCMVTEEELIYELLRN